MDESSLSETVAAEGVVLPLAFDSDLCWQNRATTSPRTKPTKRDNRADPNETHAKVDSETR